MIRPLSIGFAALLSFYSISSVSSQSLFVKCLGGSGDDFSDGGLVQTADGGWAVAGYTNSFGAGDWDCLLTKFDSTGNHEWTVTLGGGQEDKARALVKSTDGGYVIAGWTQSYGAGSMDALLAKFDSAGNHQWTRTMGGSGTDWGYSLALARDGGYVIAGKTKSFGAGDWDAFVTKFDSLGNHEWTQILGGANDDWVHYPSLIQTADGGYAVGAGTQSYGAGNWDILLTKLDSLGNLEWSTTIGGGGVDHSHSVIQTADGGYAIGGYTWSFGVGDNDFFFVKVDSVGNHEWTRTIGGGHWDQALCILRSIDGGYILTGRMEGFGQGSLDPLVCKFDSLGNFQWAKEFGGTGNDAANEIMPTVDHGYMTTGYLEGLGAGGYDLFIAKLDSSGHLCRGEFVNPYINTVSPSVDTVTPVQTSVSPTITQPSPITTNPAPTITLVCGGEGPAILTCSLWVTPDTVSIGQSIYLHMRVENIGSGDADSVVPQIDIIGGGMATLDSGPNPAYADIHSDSDTVFSWVYSGQNNGWVNWRGHASGFCQMLQQEVQSPEDTSNSLLIQTEAQLEVLIVIADTDTVRRGDEDVSVDVVLDNNGEADALVDSMNLRFVRNSQNLDDEYVTMWLNPIGVLPGLTADILHFEVDVTSEATAGWVHVHSRIFGSDKNSGETLVDTTAALPDSFIVVEGYRCGDCNADGRITVADATYIVSYVYRGGPAPIGSGDVNLDTRVTVADATYIVSYIYRGGPEPCNPPLRYTPDSQQRRVIER